MSHVPLGSLVQRGSFCCVQSRVVCGSFYLSYLLRESPLDTCKEQGEHTLMGQHFKKANSHLSYRCIYGREAEFDSSVCSSQLCLWRWHNICSSIRNTKAQGCPDTVARDQHFVEAMRNQLLKTWAKGTSSSIGVLLFFTKQMEGCMEPNREQTHEQQFSLLLHSLNWSRNAGVFHGWLHGDVKEIKVFGLQYGALALSVLFGF